jgi:hypothetical protein
MVLILQRLSFILDIFGQVSPLAKFSRHKVYYTAHFVIPMQLLAHELGFFQFNIPVTMKETVAKYTMILNYHTD